MSRSVTRAVKVAELKARLSAYLRAARGGETIVVQDRDTPIARITPYTPAPPLPTIAPSRAWGSTPLPPALGRKIDVVRVLLDQRQSSR